MGEVNPGAIVSANNNVYVWGKLFGIGPKKNPKDQYPRIAIVEDNRIIKPYLLNKNFEYINILK